MTLACFFRRTSVTLMLVALAWMVGGCTNPIHLVGGASTRSPAEYPAGLSPSARQLAREVYADVNPSRLADYHVHLVGLGENGSGCYANPRMRSWAHPFHHLRFLVYCSSGKVTDPARCESQYVERLSSLARTAPGRFLLLAFDENRSSDGRVVPGKTEFHVPNDFPLKLAAQAPRHFAAAGSVHPYRADAIAELRRLHAKGIRVIKWLPNAMGIDPSSPRCDAFYHEMRRLDMTLLTHGGMEAAVHAEEDQCLGNPQHLERALKRGVKVIVAHCASLGKGHDLQAPPGSPEVENWKLLFRMMDDPRWRHLLFADLSATTQVNRSPEFVRAILTRPDLHGRLVNGSDYPLPAVNIVISLRHWVKAGLLDPKDVPPLRELYQVNPLVFDFALKRRLRHVHPDGTVSRYAAAIFQEHPAVPID